MTKMDEVCVCVCVSELSTCCGWSTSKNGSLVRDFVIEFNEFGLLECANDLLLTNSVGQSPHWKYSVKDPDYPPEPTLVTSHLVTNRRTEYKQVKLDRQKHFKQFVCYVIKVM